jgi:hypothetical protein
LWINVPKQHKAYRTPYLVSGNTIPSSTQAIFVVVAPMFTTQAFDIPAPYVAASDSYKNSVSQERLLLEVIKRPAEHIFV